MAAQTKLEIMEKLEEKKLTDTEGPKEEGCILIG